MILVVDVRNDWIVPDVLGYFFIFIATRSFADASFRFARWCALVAGVASVFARSQFSLWPSLIQAFFEVIMICLLCTGVVHLSDANASLARSAASARALTIVSGVLNFAYAIVFYGFTIAIPHAGVGLLAFGWSVVAIVTWVMMRAGEELTH